MAYEERLKEIEKKDSRKRELERIRITMFWLRIILISLFIIIVSIALLVKYI